MATDALLARTHELHRQQPLMQTDLAALEYGPYGDGKRVAAVATEVQAGTMALAVHEAIALGSAAVRADRTGRPADTF